MSINSFQLKQIPVFVVIEKLRTTNFKVYNW